MTAQLKEKKKLLKVIVDSNAFFVPLQFNIDIFEELKPLLGAKFELILLSPIQRELEAIAEKGSQKMRKWATYALELAKKCTRAEMKYEKGDSPDDVIADVAKKWGCPVFTNDRELRRRLRDISVPVIYVRQKSRLEIEGRITPPV
jgi:rRNA-processing protein FCF1